MGERSGLIKDHRPVNCMYSEADYKELLSMAQRNEGRVVVFSQEISTLRARVARLEEAGRKLLESCESADADGDLSERVSGDLMFNFRRALEEK